MVKVICLNNGSTKEYQRGTTAKEIIEDQKIGLENDILGVLVNNKIRSLDYEFYKPKTIEFVDINHPMGFRIYMRSVFFVLYKACKELYPDIQLSIENSLPHGFYCEINGAKKLERDQIILNIQHRMNQIVEEDLAFTSEEIPTCDAVKIFRDNGLEEKAVLFETRKGAYTTVYYLNGEPNYFYGGLVPSTGYLKKIVIAPYFDGLIVMSPLKIDNIIKNKELFIMEYIRERSEGGSKFFKTLREQKAWLNIMEVPYVGYLNKEVEEGRVGRLIKISEALQEKKIAEIADDIHSRKDCRVVFISGPSSSGKTTFCKRLSVQLQVLGYKTIELSLDDYFVNRVDTPKDETGDYDYESIYAIDFKFFQKHLNELLTAPEGKTFDMPIYDFKSGERKFGQKNISMTSNTIILVEGIHGLNPIISEGIDEKYIYRIFASALTHIAIDRHNPIKSSDNRILRRMLRDSWSRGYPAIETIRRWGSVRRGEEKNIFPYQENADTMFNTALLFELGVIRKHVEPLLREIPEDVPEFATAQYLLKFLSYFKNIDDKEIPPTSILREFLGGSSFVY